MTYSQVSTPLLFIYSGAIQSSDKHTNSMKTSVFAITLLSLLISGCASQQSTSQSAPLYSNPEQFSDIDYQTGELNKQTLFELIVGEMAGQRKEFDLSLEKYLNQAEKTADPAIAKRATYIAQYLQRKPETLRASQLWQQAEPDNPEPYQIAASILLRDGDFGAALPLLRKALQHDDNQALLVISGQAAQFNEEELDAYITLLSEFSDERPSSQLHTTLGVLYKQQGNHPSAIAELEQAIALDSDNEEAVFQKAELLRLQKRYPEAITVVQPYIQQDAPNQQLYTLYVQLLFQSGAKAQATEQARQLAAMFPDEPQLNFYIALLLLDNDEIDQSRTIMQDLLTRYPNNTTPYYYLGLIEQRAENIDTAIDHFVKVRDSNNILQAYRRISDLLDNPSQRQRLQGIMQNARNALPEISIQLYIIEAEWLHLNDLSNAALNLMDEALQLHNDDVNLLYTRAMMLDPQDIDLIEQDLRQVLAVEPDNSLALNALGYTLTIYTDRFDEAYALIARAHELNPDEPAILDSMGWILFKQGDISAAIPYLEQAFNAFPDPEVSAHLIQAYYANGDEQQARQLLEQELVKHPDSEYLKQAREILSQSAEQQP